MDARAILIMNFDNLFGAFLFSTPYQSLIIETDFEQISMNINNSTWLKDNNEFAANRGR